MKIEAGIYSVLSGSTAVTALVGTRIYPGRVPQGKAHPQIRFTVSSIEQVHHLTAHSNLFEASVQIDCYTENSYLDCITLSDKVRERMNTQSTTFGTISIERSHVMSEMDEPPFQPIDSSDEWIFGRSLDVSLHFYST